MKTSRKRKGESITFNESVHFDLAPKTALQLSRMSVIVSAYARRVRGRRKRLIITAIIGSSKLATPEGREHWETMITCTGEKKSVTEWHDLLLSF